MSYEAKRDYFGCFIAPFILIFFLILLNVGYQFWSWLTWEYPSRQISEINRYVDGFKCDGLTVVRSVGQRSRNFDGGAILAMPASCRKDLMSRARQKRQWEPRGEDCLFYQGNSYRMLCVEGENIYFGDIRP